MTLADDDFKATEGHRRAVRMDRSMKASGLRLGMPREATMRSCSRGTVENKVFVMFTTMLTIYALIGDDIKLICTNKPADVYFNVTTIICMFVFTLEILPQAP